jgi:hypothetical protein
MRHLDEAAAAPDSVRARPSDIRPGAAPTLPPEDEDLFKESLRAGVRSLGELLRRRKKTK